jgi:8-oxo-dGTP pyrophosphatase MutT (NUDIX family)
MLLNKKILISRWKNSINKFEKKFLKINFIKYIERKKKKTIVAFVDSVIIDRNKKKINRAVQVEWPSVVIVPILICGKIVKTLMIEQFRIGAGKYLLEFPAGMIEGNNILDNALREIKEELNITIKRNSLKKLSVKPIHMLPSSNSQLAHFFYFKKKVTKSFLKYIDNSKSGCESDGEYLKIKVMSFKEVEKLNTSCALVGLSLIKKII